MFVLGFITTAIACRENINFRPNFHEKNSSKPRFAANNLPHTTAHPAKTAAPPPPDRSEIRCGEAAGGAGRAQERSGHWAVSTGAQTSAVRCPPQRICEWSGGEGGIRTHGTGEGTTVFETVPIDHSGTSPTERRRVILGRETVCNRAHAWQTALTPGKPIDTPGRIAITRASRWPGFSSRPSALGRFLAQGLIAY